MNLILLTGFLGAGKTTFLNNLIAAAKNRRIGILMNEFGDTSIDGTLIQGDHFDLLEVTGGSVFCACLKSDFIKGLAELLSYDLDTVFVESSGVSDPSNMASLLDAVTKCAHQSYDYKGAICIVDGLYFLKQYDLIPALHRQILYASAIVINKSDLQTPDVLDEISKKISTLNPQARQFFTAFCDVPIPELLTTLTVPGIAPTATTNTWESRPKTLILKSDDCLDYQRFGTFIHTIKNDAYRIKGFVRTTCGHYEVSCVNDFAVMNPWPKNITTSEIVIIASVGIKIISTVTRAWQRFLPDFKMTLK